MKLKNIIENKGVTLGRNGIVNRTKGYQVSKKDLMIVPVYKLRKSMLVELSTALNVGEYLGVWVNDGKVYIDISERKLSLDKALQVGRERNQISIFDWSTKDCIYCKSE